MRHLDADWHALLGELEGWRALSIFARRALLDQVRPDRPVAAAPLAGHLDVLAGSGWLVEEDGVRRISPARRPLLAALIAMDRVPVFDDPVEPSLAAYLMVHFERGEVAELLELTATAGVRRQAAGAFADPAWLVGFLDGGRALPAGEDEAAAADLRALLEWLLARGEPLPLADRQALRLPLGDARLGPALAAGLRNVLLLASLRPSDLEPVIGCWPPAVERARRARVAVPAPVAPEAVWDALSGPADLAALLAACAAEPPRLRADLTLFKRARETLESVLLPLPPWLEPVLDPVPHRRLGRLVDLLLELGLLRVAGTRGRDACLVPSEEGRALITMADGARLRTLIDRLRDPDGGPPLVPRTVRAVIVDEASASARVLAAFAELETGVFWPLEAFLHHRGRTANPLPGWVEERARAIGGWRWGRPRPLELEVAWERQLRRFLLARLLPLGGATLGHAEAAIAFAITEPGRYLVGAADALTVAERPAARIVIQPNFEIVFLAPAPLLESRLALLAERIDAGAERVGVLLRITRASAQRAAAAGLDAEAAIALLRGAIVEPVPPNVERALREWIDRCRRVTLRETVLVRCPDPETAARVLAAAGPDGRPLGDTVVELLDKGAEAKLTRALRQSGVFVDRRSR